MSDTYEKLHAILVDHLGLAPEDLRPNRTFAELQLDSLSLIELSLIIDSDLGVSAENLDPNITLGEAAEWVDRLRAGESPADEPIGSHG